MALDTLIAGRYSGAYNGVDVGITRQGYELQTQAKAEVIEESDAYGLTTIDFIYRGADSFLQFTSRAYKAGSITPFWPWGSALGKVAGSGTPIGRLASDVAASMVLTSTASTPAAAAPASLTGSRSILAPNFDARLLFDSRLREVPVRLQLLPYASGSDILHFSMS